MNFIILFVIGAAMLTSRAVSSVTSECFRLDVHSHVVPDFYREALIDGGYTVKNGTVYTDGFPVPSWDLTSHIEAMDINDVNYSTLSISAPGVNFLASNQTAAGELARRLNLAMYDYTQSYPKRLGAMCILPLPHVQLALQEIEVSKMSATDHDSTYTGNFCESVWSSARD